ncbi:MAG: peptidylprolyl isomerase [Vicinamibacteria bacterium]
MGREILGGRFLRAVWLGALVLAGLESHASLSLAIQEIPRVAIKTAFGDIEVELYEDRAPVTVANFLKYVEERRFRGATFYRVVRLGNQPDNDVKIDVVQGGLGQDDHESRLPPIPHETTRETGIVHTDGVISMARLEPGTASSEFFICVGDQPELDFGGRRNPDGQGFAAFGKVIRGMDVVRAIHQHAAKDQFLDPPVAILDVVRIR